MTGLANQGHPQGAPLPGVVDEDTPYLFSQLKVIEGKSRLCPQTFRVPGSLEGWVETRR